ncbi:MAG: PilZ domain-containing protein [Deltaproteobacteria bacterium]|nr:PilZ domain-containing protein [Deltaproteobacteria bacterium]
MENVREHERFYLSYYLKVIDRQNNQNIGHCANVSDNGMLLISEESIKIKTIYRLKMFLPEEIQGSRYFEFIAVSKWCQTDENPDFYITGFKLQNVSEEGIQVIKRLIDKFSLDE